MFTDSNAMTAGNQGGEMAFESIMRNTGERYAQTFSHRFGGQGNIEFTRQ